MRGPGTTALSIVVGLALCLAACGSGEPAAIEVSDDLWELGVSPSHDQLNDRFVGMKWKTVDELIRTESKGRYSVSQVLHHPVRNQRVVLPAPTVGVIVVVDHDDQVTYLSWAAPDT